MPFTRASLDRLRDAIDMVALVGERTELRRVGSRWMGLCPFHDERTPSFSVNAEEKLYYCFGCGASGDAIRFVEETEALDFVAAVEHLAARFGVELERERGTGASDRGERRRQRLLELLERAASYYQRALWESAEAERARRYLLRERRLDERVLREFRVGFAPDAWDRLVTAARGQGFSDDELTAAGLASQGKRGLYDRFRARVTFPICDRRGRVLGFGARTLDGADSAGTGAGSGDRAPQRAGEPAGPFASRSPAGPKYLNSPETELFRKRRALFGLDRARAAASRAGRVIVVEGYVDALALHQAGLPETLAAMGTALTGEQLAEIARLAPRAVLVFDPDPAGLAAMSRAGEIAGAASLELRIAVLPAGKDPADLVAEGATEVVQNAVASAKPLLEYQVSRLLADADAEDPDARDRAAEEALRLIASTDAGPHRTRRLVDELCDQLELPPAWVWARLRETHRALAGPRSTAAGGTSSGRVGRAARSAGAGVDRAGAGVSTRGGAHLGPTLPAPDPHAAEREFLVAALAAGDSGRAALERASRDLFASPLWRRLFDLLRSGFDDPIAIAERDGAAIAKAMTEVVHAAQARGRSDEALLETQLLQLQLRAVERRLTSAPARLAPEERAQLVRERQELLAALDRMLGSRTR